jgi:mannose-6-phosphate isomerase-like protein (cupin superfamily)
MISRNKVVQVANEQMPPVIAEETFEDRPWGRWTLIHERPGIKIKLIEISPGHRLSLQYHMHRSEFWVCLAGRVNAIIGRTVLDLAPMQSAVISTQTVHRLGNPGNRPACVLEVQYGRVLREDDIVRLEDDYHRHTMPETH